MSPAINFSRTDLLASAPEIALTAAGCLLVLLEAFAPRVRHWFATLSLAGIAGALWLLLTAPQGTSFDGRYETSALTAVLGIFLGGTAAVSVLVAKSFLARAGEERGEFYALLLWSLAGCLLMVRGLDLLIVFVGLELLSLSLYVLAGFFRTVHASAEAGLKYFLTGAFGSAFTLYGIALLFGKAGSVRIAALAAPGLASDPTVLLGVLLLFVGFGFKMALAPFHAWAPDVYAGMPTPAVTFLSVAPKGASLLVLYRVFAALFGDGIPDRMRAAVAAVAVLSMTLGNVVALAQRDIKRLLAFSGIAHMGYVTIALVVFGRNALAAAIVYLFAYLVSNAGAFAAVAALYRDESKPHPVTQLAGEGRRSPFAAAVLALCLFSLAGIPATSGFVGKFFVFKAAIERAGEGGGGLFYALAIVGVVNSVISLGYYLRVVYTLYMKDSVEPDGAPALSASDGLALAVCGAAVLVLGIFPASLWREALRAAGSLPLFTP
jgi:NADH-quinone oxidoreductase subunit N